MPNAVTLAREKSGLKRATAARYAGISHQVLRNLENTPDATRATNPADCKVRTILALCELYWPHLRLEDVIPECRFRLAPVDARLGRKLRRDVGKPLDCERPI